MNNVDGQIKHYRELIKRLEQQKYDAIVAEREQIEGALLNFIYENWALDVKVDKKMYEHLYALVEWMAHLSHFTTDHDKEETE